MYFFFLSKKLEAQFVTSSFLLKSQFATSKTIFSNFKYIIVHTFKKWSQFATTFNLHFIDYLHLLLIHLLHFFAVFFSILLFIFCNSFICLFYRFIIVFWCNFIIIFLFSFICIFCCNFICNFVSLCTFILFK